MVNLFAGMKKPEPSKVLIDTLSSLFIGGVFYAFGSYAMAFGLCPVAFVYFILKGCGFSFTQNTRLGIILIILFSLWIFYVIAFLSPATVHAAELDPFYPATRWVEGIIKGVLPVLSTVWASVGIGYYIDKLITARKTAKKTKQIKG